MSPHDKSVHAKSVKASAVIFGLAGPVLTPVEAAFFRDINPWGFILFARNVQNPKQVKRLTSDLREAVGRDCLIFIDQEGGRVQRLRPPHWANYPSGADYAFLYEKDKSAGLRATYLAHRLIADDLRSLGITANCAPVLDIPRPGADPIISDRAFGVEVDTIITLAHAATAGLMNGGVAPVIKHIPGHGRAEVDSHKALPMISAPADVLDGSDFIPFRAFSDAPMAMTAHAVYSYVDDAPVTLSKKAIKDVVRGTLGFDGLLMSDDLDMKALSGNSLETKAVDALRAGCDVVLQCSGQLGDMVYVAKGVKALRGKAKERAMMAELAAIPPRRFNRETVKTEFSQLMPDVELVA